MKNFEKFEKELLEMAKTNDNLCISKKDNKPHKSVGMNCSDCLLKSDTATCRNMLVQWLYEEYKEPIKLSRLEYELLKYFKKLGFEYIVRDEDGDYVYMYSDKVHKGKSGWFYERGDVEALRLFKDYFQFVEWADEEPYSIQAILDNCEVTDNVH